MTFDTSQSLVEESGKKYIYMCVVNFKIEFSAFLKPIKESVTHVEGFSNLNFEISVDDKTFYVILMGLSLF
jgi:hypothetical protein